MNLFRKVRILKVDPKEPEMEAIILAAEVLREGGLVAFPTETVYGLGGNLLNKVTVERVYKVKNRPKNKPLTIHISNINTVKDIVGNIPPIVQKLIDRFWPGPLTLILKAKDGENYGFRMPSNRIARSLIEASGVPVVAPSANLSGMKPPRSTKEIMQGLGDKIDMIVDGGSTEIGIESTVLDTTVFPYRVLREGAIKKTQLKDAWHYDE